MTTPLASMTGYARRAGEAAGRAFVCEAKTVNARGLDIRMRLAPGLDALEVELRRLVGEKLARGALTFGVAIEAGGDGGGLVVNEQALATVLGAMQTLSKRITAEPPRLEGILALKGVLETRDTPTAADGGTGLADAIRAAASDCLDDLVAARRGEGAHLGAAVAARIDEIETLATRAAAHPAASREAVLERLTRQVADLAAGGNRLSEERLHQEAMLLATKADISEEIERLHAHVAAARALLAAGGPAGRRLDFLAQEFNREANTLCAKAGAVELTAIGLDLKAAIDQLREQVQNIE